MVVCLAAGLSQKPVIERAKASGFYVIGVDRDPHAAAGHLCDQMIHLSTHEPEPLIKALKNNPFSHRITAVLNRSSGPPVVTTAAINEAFALPGVPVKRARQCLNKDYLREECLLRHLSVVGYQVAQNFSQLKTEKISLPCVMKPALSMVGKQGVVVVRQAEQMQDAFTRAQLASVTGKVLVEDYLPGFDVSVIAFVNHGRLEILAYLDEINQRHPDGSVSGKAMAVPSRFFKRPEAKRLAQLACRVVEVFEIEHSPLLLSCRITDGGQPQLMEIHLDMGGDKILDVLLPAAGEFDALGYMIRALTTKTKLDITPPWNPTAVIFRDGDGLISNRPHDLLHATTLDQLEQIITAAIGEVPRP